MSHTNTAHMIEQRSALLDHVAGRGYLNTVAVGLGRPDTDRDVHKFAAGAVAGYDV